MSNLSLSKNYSHEQHKEYWSAKLENQKKKREELLQQIAAKNLELQRLEASIKRTEEKLTLVH